MIALFLGGSAVDLQDRGTIRGQQQRLRERSEQPENLQFQHRWFRINIEVVLINPKESILITIELYFLCLFFRFKSLNVILLLFDLCLYYVLSLNVTRNSKHRPLLILLLWYHYVQRTLPIRGRRDIHIQMHKLILILSERSHLEIIHEYAGLSTVVHLEGSTFGVYQQMRRREDIDKCSYMLGLVLRMIRNRHRNEADLIRRDYDTVLLLVEGYFTNWRVIAS